MPTAPQGRRPACQPDGTAGPAPRNTTACAARPRSARRAAAWPPSTPTPRRDRAGVVTRGGHAASCVRPDCGEARRPRLQPSGACGQCSARTMAVHRHDPGCDVPPGRCVACLANADCDAPTAPACNRHKELRPLRRRSDCAGACPPACQPEGSCGSARRRTRRPAAARRRDCQRTCVGCLTNADCPRPAAGGDGASATCRFCTSDASLRRRPVPAERRLRECPPQMTRAALAPPVCDVRPGSASPPDERFRLPRSAEPGLRPAHRCGPCLADADCAGSSAGPSLASRAAPAASAGDQRAARTGATSSATSRRAVASPASERRLRPRPRPRATRRRTPASPARATDCAASPAAGLPAERSCGECSATNATAAAGTPVRHRERPRRLRDERRCPDPQRPECDRASATCRPCTSDAAFGAAGRPASRAAAAGSAPPPMTRVAPALPRLRRPGRLCVPA